MISWLRRWLDLRGDGYEHRFRSLENKQREIEARLTRLEAEKKAFILRREEVSR